MKKTSRLGGFTLIELLTVISTISLLTSIMFAGITITRSKARDSHRAQEVRQIDNAIHLYASANGSVPDLHNTTSGLRCGTGAFDVNDWTIASRCIAISNAAPASDQGKAWADLITQISPYMKVAPVDPCPSCTTTVVGTGAVLNPGYVYVSPAAVYYYCNMVGGGAGTAFCTTQTIGGYTYEMYAAREQNPLVTGLSSARNAAETCFLISQADTSTGESSFRSWALNLVAETAHANILPSLQTRGTCN